MNGPFRSREIGDLIAFLSRLPGLGPKSAQRVVVHLMKTAGSLERLSEALAGVARKASPCRLCCGLDTQDPCSICADDERRSDLICVVENIDDLWSFEKTGVYDGRYHVLGGALSTLDGLGPDQLNIAPLGARLADAAREGNPVKEIIIATGATVSGQITAHYLSDYLSSFGVEVSRLASGVPIGGELHYLDAKTLAAALKARALFPN